MHLVLVLVVYFERNREPYLLSLIHDSDSLVQQNLVGSFGPVQVLLLAGVLSGKSYFNLNFLQGVVGWRVHNSEKHFKVFTGADAAEVAEVAKALVWTYSWKSDVI